MIEILDVVPLPFSLSLSHSLSDTKIQSTL